MSTETIARPPRRAAPPMPAGEVALEPPPAIPNAAGPRWQQWLSVVPMLAGTAATAMMFGGREGASAFTYIVGAIFGLSTLGMLITNWGSAGGPRRAELLRARRDYLRYLSGVRHRVRATIIEQRDAMNFRHPEPSQLWAEALGQRIWERRPRDADFAVVRVGAGAQSLATPLVPPALDPSADLEPVTAGALRRFVIANAVVPDLPISLAARAFARVIIRGGGARALARAMVCQLATFHAPHDLTVAACVGPERWREWDWLKWLPHALHPTAEDDSGPVRLVAGSPGELGALLADLRGHVVLVVDGGDIDEGRPGVTVLDIDADAPRNLDRDTMVLTADANGALSSSTVDGTITVGRADAMSAVEAEGVARLLAPIRLTEATRGGPPRPEERTLIDLLGIVSIDAADVDALWAPRASSDVLRVPIGVGADGARVDLDLKEAAQDGMGPHGLVVGATGSGKSELLRTLVLGLAATHSPEALNFVLVDFKGGATFAGLDRLRHTSAIITNLEDALPLVDRMKDAMSGELTRRQELLRRAGPYASLREYDRARARGAALAPVPSLLLVCDEFTEMLTAKPDLIDLFVQIGRIGRSIGVHLLLATQRLEEGRLRGLETNLSYRIALRTFTAHESRMTLGGASDAAELPATPGHGFLRVGTGPLVRFTAAYVSGPLRRTTATAPTVHSRRMVEFQVRRRPTDAAPASSAVAAAAPVGEPPDATLMDAIVRRLAGHGAPAHRVWLPPLADSPDLDSLLGPVTRDEARGVGTTDPHLRGALRLPIAVVDRPYEQRRDTAWLDLTGAAGHVAIVGGPQSGKSTAVRTLIAALALTHTPREVQIYCLDFGGGSLNAVRGLPHVGGVAGRLDAPAVRRTVGEVATLLADRERRFAARGVDSVATFRRMRRPSDMDATLAIPEDGFGDVFLVVDGWPTLRHDFEDLELIIGDVATRGLSYGVHIVATASRWTDLRHTIKDLFGSRLELRLGDPGDSAINRTAAANVPEARPGRGLTADGFHLLTALPRTAGLGPSELIEVIAAAWPGSAAPPVRMLPALLPYDELLGPVEGGQSLPLGDGLCLPLGIAESDLRPVLVDFAAESHLIAFGDSECGKSTLLRSLAESITRRFSPERARIVVIDYRRSLLGAIRTDHLIGYGTASENAAQLLESVASYMDRRLPGPDVTPEQLRDRSWWRGPECFVLVDDYDLVASGLANPLAPLLNHLSHARDVGLHVIVVRRAGGAGRALHEPVLQRLRELGTPTLVMSGEREEGALAGAVRPGPQPPGRGWLVTRREGARLIQLAVDLGWFVQP